MLLMLLIRMDMVRWSEYIAIQWILFSVNALVHVSTTYPDAGGYQSSCIDPDKHVAGAWMWHYITTAYCGDMMWSGHTQETLLPIIMIRRLMWDWLGHRITPLTQPTLHSRKVAVNCSHRFSAMSHSPSSSPPSLCLPLMA